MAWFDNIQTATTVTPYSPDETRQRNAQSKSFEISNKGAQFKQTQEQNMDHAFTNSVEQKKTVDPKTGAITYSLYLDPDKYTQALFTQSKKTGVPFNMDDAQAYSKYQLDRQTKMNEMTRQGIQSSQYGLVPEGKVTKSGTQPQSQPGIKDTKTIKTPDGLTWTWNGAKWATTTQDTSNGVGF